MARRNVDRSTDLDSLDAAFDLPDTITDPKLRGLYEVLVARMRDEAKHLPMNTVQQLLIERIAYNYIVMRHKERGDLGGFGSTNVQKDFNTFWLTMTAEFNKMLSKGPEPMVGSERKVLLREIQQIVVNTVSTVVDPKTRGVLLETMAANFEKAGI